MRIGDNRRAQLLLDDLFNFVEPTPDQTKLIAKAAKEAGTKAIRTITCRSTTSCTAT